ncbi:hypothetical protein IQ07DRAFT_628993 [Pyrenochaeta sp. DS3sAY3a]|nr:hypothetical protein IQ07DRAFT_628993 [Pyrenochaeta sp. DS3sAY3a]
MESRNFEYAPLDPSKNEIRLLFPILGPRQERPQGVGNDTANTVDSLREARSIVRPDLSMHFELRVVSLDDSPEYTALSYVWGKPQALQEITVEDHDFPVTENLYSALRHMQYTTIQPAIWIDAICIDQTNTDEKNDQVPRMGDLYSRAKRVLVWLGPGDQKSDQAITILQKASQIFSDQRTEFRYEYLEDHREEHQYNVLLLKFSCEVIDALTKAIEICDSSPSSIISDLEDFENWRLGSIMAFGWWYRIWTIQEFALATAPLFQLGWRTLTFDDINFLESFGRCSNDITSWKECQKIDEDTPVASLMMTMGSRNKMVERPIHLEFVHPSKSVAKVQPTFFDVLLRTHCGRYNPIGCKEDVDRIFALRGLAEEDFTNLGIVIDYRRSKEQVYTDAARRIIQSGNLDILSLCQRPDPVEQLQAPPETSASSQMSHQLPSWAMDWSGDIELPNYWFWSKQNKVFHAAGSSIRSVSFNSDSSLPNFERVTSMNIVGVLIGDITETSSHRRRGKDLSRYHDQDLLVMRKEILQLLDKSAKLGHTVYSRSQRCDAVWRIPAWDLERCDEEEWRRATKRSKHHYKLCHHWALASQAFLAEPKSSIKHSYHWANSLVSAETLGYKMIEWLFVLLFLSPLGSLSFMEFLTIRFQGRSWDAQGEYGRTQVIGSATRLFMTQHGYIGHGPQNTRPGDIVCIFLGGNVPYILRKKDSGEPGYVLIGEAFVYGGMWGELLQGREQVEFKIY